MTLRVLAIDDSLTIRSLLAVALSDAGFEVHFAEDGSRGLERFKEAEPDVVITDINMPVLDGFGFIEAVRRLHPGSPVPILVLTTESSPALKDRARRAGASGWIVKPFDEERLIDAIERVAAR